MTTGPARSVTARPAVASLLHRPSARPSPTFRSCLSPAPAPAAPAVAGRDRAHGLAIERDTSRELAGPRARRSERRRPDREPEPELTPFRPLPSVLVPSPPPPPVLVPTPRLELAQLAERLVTRLRVGRGREGAVVELRLALGDRELDVRLIETAQGIVLDAPDDVLRAALVEELGRRGITLERSA